MIVPGYSSRLYSNHWILYSATVVPTSRYCSTAVDLVSDTTAVVLYSCTSWYQLNNPTHRAHAAGARAKYTFYIFYTRTVPWETGNTTPADLGISIHLFFWFLRCIHARLLAFTELAKHKECGIVGCLLSPVFLEAGNFVLSSASMVPMIEPLTMDFEKSRRTTSTGPRSDLRPDL
jgi:hypothetical protein